MKKVLFDIDTQFDFVLSAGSLYVPGAETLLDGWSSLAHFAAKHSIPLLSTVDAHSENDPEFVTWKPHCVIGTVGQQKPAQTLLPRSVVLPSAPVDLTGLNSDGVLAPQVMLEKQHTNCFTNANLAPLLSRLQPELCIVYGVVTEICVQEAALGLLELGYRVQILTDMVRSLNPEKAEILFELVQSKGGTLTTALTLMAE